MAYPHNSGCAGCRSALLCNYCGGPTARRDRCTNGRCPRCHDRVCTPGGAYDPGHGSGLTREQVTQAATDEKADHGEKP